MRSRWAIWFVYATLAFAATASPLLAHGVPERLRACKTETDDKLRLACFDRELARSDDASRGKSAPVFDDLDEPLTATVTQVSERQEGSLLVTLDNGQAYSAERTLTYVPLQAGDVVTIRGGALGSMFLITPSKRSLKVKRVR